MKRFLSIIMIAAACVLASGCAHTTVMTADGGKFESWQFLNFKKVGEAEMTTSGASIKGYSSDQATGAEQVVAAAVKAALEAYIQYQTAGVVTAP